MSDQQSIRVALIGPGAHARRYLIDAIKKTPSLELFAIVGGREGPAIAGSIPGASFFPALSAMTASVDVDACVIATPPSTHARLVLQCLEAGMHVLCEKPLTVDLESTLMIADAARERALVLAEGFMFLHHPQFAAIQQVAASHPGTLQARFGFPHRSYDDFRYSGPEGGALLDVGVYPIAAANALLPGAQVRWATMYRTPKYDVDIGGAAVVASTTGQYAFLEWGFGREYVNEISLWGDILLTADRAFSKPPAHEASITIHSSGGVEFRNLGAFDHFQLELEDFARRIFERTTGPDPAIGERAKIVHAIRAAGGSS